MPIKSITITGVNEVTAKLKRVNDFLMSTTPMQETCDDIKAGVLDKTAKGHDYMGRNFKPLSKIYAKAKGKSRADLRDTGEMLDGMTAKALSNKQGEVAITGRRAIVGWFHNEGGPKEGRPPQREFMNISDSGLANIVKKRFDDPLMKLLGRK